MKKILILLFVLSLNNQTFAAGSDSSSDVSETALYDQAVKLVKRAGKLEKKDKHQIGTVIKDHKVTNKRLKKKRRHGFIQKIHSNI